MKKLYLLLMVIFTSITLTSCNEEENKEIHNDKYKDILEETLTFEISHYDQLISMLSETDENNRLDEIKDNSNNSEEEAYLMINPFGNTNSAILSFKNKNVTHYEVSINDYIKYDISLFEDNYNNMIPIYGLKEGINELVVKVTLDNQELRVFNFEIDLDPLTYLGSASSNDKYKLETKLDIDGNALATNKEIVLNEVFIGQYRTNKAFGYKQRITLNNYKGDYIGNVITNVPSEDHVSVEMHNNLLYFGSSANNYIYVKDLLGRTINEYHLGDYYQLHHDLDVDNDGNIYALITYNNTTTGIYEKEDLVMTISEDGLTKSVIDFKDHFPNVFHYANDTDWLHINSIDYYSDNKLVLSGRELSTIIFYDLTTNKVEYMIGDELYWNHSVNGVTSLTDNTLIDYTWDYTSYLLTKDGDFDLQYGQHSVEVIDYTDTTITVSMFNNNTSFNFSYFDIPSTIEGINTYSEYRTYEINISNKTFTLVDTIQTDFSMIMSNASHYDNGYILTPVSTTGSTTNLYQYNSNKELILALTEKSESNYYRIIREVIE